MGKDLHSHNTGSSTSNTVLKIFKEPGKIIDKTKKMIYAENRNINEEIKNIKKNS